MNSLNTCKQAPQGGLAAWFRLVIAQASTRISGPCSARRNYGGPLRANGQAVRRVLHVGARNHGSVLQQQCGSDAKFGIGRVRVVSRIRRLRGQLPQQLRGESCLACLHRPLSVMAVRPRRNTISRDGGSPRIYPGKERFSAPAKSLDLDHAL